VSVGSAYLSPAGEILCGRCRERLGGEALPDGEGRGACDRCGAPLALPVEAERLQRLSRYLRYVGFDSRVVAEGGLRVEVPYAEGTKARVRATGEGFALRFAPGEAAERGVETAAELYRRLLDAEHEHGRVVRRRRHETRRALWHPEFHL
jgi:hypothetical protein